MKIWFDLSNTPHVNLFKGLIKELSYEHEIIVTTRPLGNVIELLQVHNIEHSVVGIYYGKNIIKKIYGFFIRVFKLYRFLKMEKVDIAVSQSSFHSPLVAFLLNVPSIYMNDNEHALGNVPAFLFADKIFLPESFDLKVAKKQCARKKKIIQYKGLKEGIYLWDFKVNNNDKEVQRNKIFFRPEPWTAQYYNGPKNYLDDLIRLLAKEYCIVVLPRSEDQLNYYLEKNYKNFAVLRKPIELKEIVNECLIFIGAGGTMSREMAVLGIPTISVYQAELLGVDQYLIKRKLLFHIPKLELKDVYNVIKARKNVVDANLLEFGKETYNMLKKTIIEIGEKK